MKNKILTVISATALLSIATFSVASAQGVGSGSINANAKAQVQVELNARGEANRNDNAGATTQGNATSSAAQTGVRGNATSTEAKDNRGNATSTKARDERGNATSTDARDDGQLTAETHRSAVASFVQSLLNVANREGGIGAQVRVIAQAQNDSASTSAEAIAKVENRGKLRTFLFGSDYKSLGTLRSEIATTTSNIKQLKNLTGKATSDADKAELSAQIKVLEDSQAKIDAFVIKQTTAFSLFGWFTKLFVK